MALFYVLLVSFLAFASADTDLEAFAQSVANSFEVNHVIGQNGQNSPFLSLTNGEHLTMDLVTGVDKKEKVKVKVTFVGLAKVTVERNGKSVDVTKTFGGGAAAVIKESEKEDSAQDFQQIADDDDGDKYMAEVLNPLYDEYSKEALEENELGVLIAHGAQTKVKVKDDKRSADAKIEGGFIVGVKTKVKKA